MTNPLTRSSPAPRRIAFWVTFATLAVFGVLLTVLALRVRSRLRSAVLQREAEAIHAVALLELARASGMSAAAGATDPMPQLFAAALESSRLRGVMLVQVFDADGQLRRALPDLGRFEPAERWWPTGTATPLARYHPAKALEELFDSEVEIGAEPTRVPLVEIIIPLRIRPEATSVDGTARYWIDGTAVAAEFSRLDRELALQTGLAYLGTAALVGAVLAWAFRTLGAANRELAAQSADLARANRELDFAAKTGAIGAISAHLIHGIKNPLAGLESFVSDPNLAAGSAPGAAWRAAAETTQRLRSMVQEVMQVLRDEADGRADYPVPMRELLGAVQQRTRAAAEAAGVRVLVVDEANDAPMIARTANLAGLVLANLVANAVDAAPRDSVVTLRSRRVGANVEIHVEDAGAGLPTDVRAQLFQPVQSAKPQGGGVGLALSRQLARHAGGELALVRSDATGTVFCLRIPLPATAA
jgi:signal transduction histidine kinase